MNSDLSNAFAAGSGVVPADMKVVIVSICGALVFIVALWLVGRLLEDYRSRAIEASEVLHGIAYLAVPVVLLITLLAWL
jgi:integrating conjugative element protein (TIGR03758 family)